MNLEARTLERVAQEFPVGAQAAVLELLSSYAGPEPARVVWDVLALSQGQLENVRRYLAAAQIDYRDVLYWAEYYGRDPLVRGGAAKKMVDDLLAKWGRKN